MRKVAFQISKFSIYRPSDWLCFSNLYNIKNLCRNINFTLLGLIYIVPKTWDPRMYGLNFSQENTMASISFSVVE